MLQLYTYNNNNIYIYTWYVFNLSRQPSSSQVPVLYYRSKPLTALRPLGPTSDITVCKDLITVLQDETTTYYVGHQLPPHYCIIAVLYEQLLAIQFILKIDY